MRLGCLLSGVAVVVGLGACGGADRASWAEKADAVCARAGARIAAVGRPESIDDLGPAARRAAGHLGAAGAEIGRLERPAKDPDITRLTRGFGVARSGLLRLADAVAHGDERTATAALHGLERERRAWSDAAGAVGMRRCGTAARLTAALDALRRPLYAHELAAILTDFSVALRIAAKAAEEGGRRVRFAATSEASLALDDLRSGLDGLDPPRSLAARTRAWSASIEALDTALFDVIDAESRHASDVVGIRRAAALVRAVRAESRARRRVLRSVDLGGSVPVVPQETSPS